MVAGGFVKTIIIGGGLPGLSSANVLSDQGYEAEVYEAGDVVASGASYTNYTNGGMLTTSMSDPWNAPGVCRHLLVSLFNPYTAMKLRIKAIPSLFSRGLQFLRNSSQMRHRNVILANFRLVQYAIQKTVELREKLFLQYEASSAGTLKIFRSTGAMDGPKRLTQELAASGLRFNVLDVAAVVGLEPVLEPRLAGRRDQIAGAPQFPDDESGDTHLFWRALLDEIQKTGVPVHTGTRIPRLLVENGRVIGVETEQKDVVKADRIVIATGVQTESLLKGTGFSLPVKPVKGYSLTFDIGDSALMPGLPVIDGAMYAAITPLGKQLRVVGTAEFAGYDTRIEQVRINNLFRLLEQIYPGIAVSVNRNDGQAWAGLQPMSSDGKPFTGPPGIDGLYFNTGYGHLGWTTAMGSAYVLADLMHGSNPEIDSTPFQVHR